MSGNNQPKKSIEKSKNDTSKSTHGNIVLQAERSIPCFPGTVLPIGQNIVAFTRMANTIVRFQMSTMQENRTAIDVKFMTAQEAEFFISYLEIWNSRDKITVVSLINTYMDGEKLIVQREGGETSFVSMDNKQLYKLYVAANEMRNEYVNERQKYDRFWFSIYEDTTKGAALYGSINTFNFSFKEGTLFTLVCNVKDVFPGVDLH